ncbi:ParB family protein [Kineobactrum sediminis]|uniref:ParB family protein n=1 Tax=Kineobactrum sediminis TaxID=1905677 RepID=UPI0013902315|nr:ParB family protein [Kineobactrum sediminis]
MKAQRSGAAANAADTGVLQMPLSDLQAYEHNPRHGSNTEYQRIKASIRSQGLDQPLVVTRRPGEDHYVPLVGGNTRLQVLKELYQETGDERFGTIHCLYRPWTEESQVLLAHLRENELRGNLIFIDKALAVQDLKAILEKESRERQITLRRLAKIMTHRGLSISHTMISRMVYAAERLLPLMPQALNAGLGRPQIEKIHALEKAFLTLWQRHALGSETECAETFAALCQRYDSPEWNLQLLRTALENELAEAVDVSLHSIRLRLDDLLSGRGYSELVVEPLVSPFHPDPDLDSDADPDPDAEPETAVCEPEPAGGATPAKSTTQPCHPLDTLRLRAYTLAAGLAEHYGLAPLIVQLPAQGLGFMLADIPPRELRDTLDPALLAEMSCLWWHLAACAELTVAPPEQVLPWLAPDSVLTTALMQRDKDVVQQHLWTLDPGQWGSRLWRPLCASDWGDLLALMSTYRTIHDTAERTGMAVWSDKEECDVHQQGI